MNRTGNKSCNVIVTPSNLKVKGKMASLTENKRLSGEMIVWPLIFELDRPFFTVREYQAKRDYVSGRCGIQNSRIRSGFVSLIYRGFVTKGAEGYSLNWGLQNYMHRGTILGYEIAAKEYLGLADRVLSSNNCMRSYLKTLLESLSVPARIFICLKRL